jgi:hypothetical protein
MTAPPTTGWTYQNAAGTWTSDAGGLVATDLDEWAQRDLVSGITTIFCQGSADGTFPVFGFWEKGTTKSMRIFMDSVAAQSVVVSRYNAGGGFNSTAASFTQAVGTMNTGVWLQVEKDGTTIYFRWSPDGENWWTVHSEAKGSFFTTEPDAVIFRMRPSGVVRVWSWEE